MTDAEYEYVIWWPTVLTAPSIAGRDHILVALSTSTPVRLQ